MSGERQLIGSGAPWEATVGYSRAVRQGPFVFVAGTTALDAEGRLVGPGDAHAQALQCLANIEAALVQAGATIADVVRTRMYVTDIARWDEVGRAHGLYFAATRPAATMVEVRQLIDPAMLVEIEADALIQAAPAQVEGGSPA